MADWGAFAKGIDSGLSNVLAVNNVIEKQKAAEWEKKYVALTKLSETLSNDKLPESFRMGLVDTYNQLNEEVFSSMGVKPPKWDGKFDGSDKNFFKKQKAAMEVIQEKNITDPKEAKDIFTGLVNDAQALMAQDKEKGKSALSQLAGGISSMITPEAVTIPTGKFSPAPADYTQQAKYMAGGGQGMINPVATPDTVTQLPSDAEKMATMAKSYIKDPEGGKMIDEALAEFQRKLAAGNLNQREGQPESIRKRLEQEAMVNTGEAGQKFAAPVITQESKAEIAEKNAEWKPSKPDGIDPTTMRPVFFDSNRRSYIDMETNKPVVVRGQLLPLTEGRTPATEVGKGVMLDTIAGNIERINNSYKDDYVGFVTGRAKQLQANTVGGLPDEQAAFYADVNDIADMLLRARSGAQINETEYQRLAKLVPTPNLPPSTFKARMKRFEEQLYQIMGSQKKRLKEGGYMAPKSRGKETAAPSPAKKMTFNPATGAFE